MKYFWLPLLASLSLAAHAQSSCSSDGTAAPAGLLERFVNADCAACWIATDTPKAAKGDLAIDWVVPGAKGDDAPMSAVASNDALARLEALHVAVPGVAAYPPRLPRMEVQRLRVAHGQPFNDYIGVGIEFRPTPGAKAAGPWTAWLALVETLPVGTEGSPVERNLVRNVLQLEWKRALAVQGKLSESRSMSLPEGVKPERLRVAGWVEDARGQVVAMAVSACVIDK